MGAASGKGSRTRGQLYAVDETRAEYLRHRVKGSRQIAKVTGLGLTTVNDFFAGKRWPHPDTLWSFEEPLGWEPGRIQRMADDYDNGNGKLEIEPQSPIEAAIWRSNMTPDEKRALLAALWDKSKDATQGDIEGQAV